MNTESEKRDAPSGPRNGLALQGPELERYLAFKRQFGNFHLYGKFVTPNKLYPFNNQRGVTGSQLALVANKARQRRKGPLVRFGRKYER